MTSHTPTYKRLNTGQPGVCVRSWATLSGKTNLKPWYAKRYRRAVMQGAGVYLLGLWGVVMGRGKRKSISKPPRIKGLRVTSPITWLLNCSNPRQKAEVFSLAYLALRKKKIRKNYTFLIAPLIKRADHYRAFLSRIVKTRKCPARIPRPIHTRPRPPAAPLAPPIFA